MKGETFAQAAEALVKQLQDWELTALIDELQASIARSSESGTIPSDNDRSLEVEPATPQAAAPVVRVSTLGRPTPYQEEHVHTHL